MSMNTHVEVFKYDSGRPGKALGIMGAVHGHEKCGAFALQKLKAQLDAGEVKLKSGRLVLIPAANPEAFAANKRLIERNLNRFFSPKPEAERKHYEDHLDHQIAEGLEGVDYLLDLHSYTASGPPFAFINGADRKTRDFAASLGVTRNFVWGWADAFADKNAPPKESWGAVEYVRSLGVCSMTLECGQHLDPQAPDVAYAAALNAMAYLGLIDEAVARGKTQGLSLPPLGSVRYAKMKTLVRNAPSTLVRPFKHLDPLKKGEALAQLPNGEIEVSPIDGYAVMPFPTAPVGDAILYLAVEEEPAFGT
jgi:predicted deacylase